MDYLALNKDIKHNKINNLYLFNVTDKYIADMMLKNMEKKLINMDFADFNYTKFDDKKINVDAVIERCETYPMFDEKRLILIKTEGLKGKEDFSKIAEFLKDIPDFCYIVFYAKKSLDKRGKLYKTIKKKGKVVELDKFKGTSLENWILTKLSKEHIVLSRDAVNYFIEASGYLLDDSEIDLGYFVSEMEKIKNLKKQDVGLEDVRKIISININEEIFKLTDALRDKDNKRAFRLLHNLEYKKVGFMSILGVVSKNLENMYICKEFMKAGKNEKDIVDKHHLHPYAVKMANLSSKKYSKKDINRFLSLCFDLDYRFKTGQIGEKEAGRILAEKIVNR